MDANKSCSWFSYVFTYTGNNHALLGFFNAITLAMETGFAVTAFLALLLNLILPEEIEDEEIPELTADAVDEEKDREEWNKIRKSVDHRAMSVTDGEAVKLPKEVIALAEANALDT
jgi:hypothetical protein